MYKKVLRKLAQCLFNVHTHTHTHTDCNQSLSICAINSIVKWPIRWQNAKLPESRNMYLCHDVAVLVNQTGRGFCLECLPGWIKILIFDAGISIKCLESKKNNLLVSPSFFVGSSYMPVYQVCIAQHLDLFLLSGKVILNLTRKAVTVLSKQHWKQVKK